MLIIFEMANNHNGSMELAKRIIDGCSGIQEKHNIKSAIKFQYRSDNFIHKDYSGSDYKHVKRFEDTRLSYQDYEELEEFAHDRGLMVLVTPFDEDAVDRINGDTIKIASCSIADWPLLEKISSTGKKVIISTGGATIQGIDNITSFFRHKGIEYALLHCVPEYPTVYNFNINFIETLKKRYGVTVGYSGHEEPHVFGVVAAAIAKGAEILERHVGIDNLNKYSMDMEQLEIWIRCISAATDICGDYDKDISQSEKDNIFSLQRGAYASKPIPKGSRIDGESVYYAFPCIDMDSGSVGRYRTDITASKDYKEGEPIEEKVSINNHIATLRGYVHRARGMIMEAGISLGDAYTVELSHHYGLKDFEQYGAVIINLINREYCKKLMVIFPGQFHPEHHHVKKEETFHIISGSMHVGGVFNQDVKAGDILLVERYRPHSFSTVEGCIFEEVSTTSIRGDSFYKDEKIYLSDPMERKTVIEKL